MNKEKMGVRKSNLIKEVEQGARRDVTQQED